ncbi:Stp1/IreP family PP2C-type Ser/Thr phosphatase [Propionivibrio limicola]|uniref:Stp1/IreP family PP2C-type Ser/Thr phosphatase n=1 Tax=Propionivibrio limicola TaxID=167645 RepID=UPI001291BD37|nr:Stp1/IreP family PP2C-type Ser/Thr phosphatase [Propionivibrio limicola]
MPTRLHHALDIALHSDTGRVREHNEDAVFANPDLGLVLLADGMGGYNAGEVASSLAIMHLSSRIGFSLAGRPACATHPPSGQPYAHDCLRDSIQSANMAILQAAARHPECAGMGTTLAAALFFDNRVMVAHIGDSRCYRLRGEDFSLLTHDHSLLQEQLDEGKITAAEARLSPNRHVLTRALGAEADARTEIAEHDVRLGDLFLLCSDGLTDMLPERQIKRVLQNNEADDLNTAACHLIDMANERGGRDNISLILVRIAADFRGTPERPTSAGSSDVAAGDAGAAVATGWLSKLTTRFS